MSFVRYWLPVLLWALAIFIGSSIPSVQVSENGVIDFISHKLVHLLEYAILNFLFYRALVNGRKVWEPRIIWTSFLAAVLYGLSDELHQIFTPGRSPRVRDVLVDAMGSFLGIFLWKYSLRARKKP